jgi:hypothetical protein
MQAIRWKTEHDVARFDFRSINHLLTIDNTDDATYQVVFTVVIHSGHLRCFSPDQCATGRATCARKSAQKLTEHARVEFPTADIIEKEKRARSKYSDVVNTVIYQISADRVMPI